MLSALASLPDKRTIFGKNSCLEQSKVVWANACWIKNIKRWLCLSSTLLSTVLFLIRGAWTPQARPHKTCRKHVISVCLPKLNDMVKLVRKNTGKLASHILFNGAMPREKWSVRGSYAERWKNRPWRLFGRNGCEFDSQGANKYEISMTNSFTFVLSWWVGASSLRAVREAQRVIGGGPITASNRFGWSDQAPMMGSMRLLWDKRCDTRRAIVHQRNGQGKD